MNVYINGSFVRTTMLSEGTAYRHDLSVHNPEGYTHFGITDGKLTTPQQYYFRRDHLGSNVAVWNATRDTTVQRTWYYASGTPMSNSIGQSTQSYKYNGKEFVEIFGNNTYDYGFRGYHAITGRFTTMDPLAEKFYDISPYAYCGGNPIRYIDILGLDTISITYDSDNEKWQISDPIIAEGDDVFIVTENGESSTYTFSEGEYGKRVDMLNLGEIGGAMLGVYHISGAQELGTGFYVMPGGEASTYKKGARIEDKDHYLFKRWSGDVKWQKPLIGDGGLLEGRGVRVHYVGYSDGDFTAVAFTDGCAVLSYDYKVKNGKIYFNHQTSRAASENFDKYLGAIGHRPYVKNGIKRYGAIFPKQIKHTLNLKSR